jgi:hypothetical protein
LGVLVAADTLFVRSGTHRVGINQITPMYDLDVTGSSRITGTLFIEGNLACSTIQYPSTPVTLSGPTQVFTFPNIYVKKITIGFIQSEFWASSALGANNFVIQLGTNASIYVGLGYSGGYGTIAVSPNVGNFQCGIAISNTSPSVWSGIHNGQIVITNMGSNIWVWEGSCRLGTTVGLIFGGSVDCGANIIDRIRVSCSTSTATYTANASSNMRGQMNVGYEY